MHDVMCSMPMLRRRCRAWAAEAPYVPAFFKKYPPLASCACVFYRSNNTPRRKTTLVPLQMRVSVFWMNTYNICVYISGSNNTKRRKTTLAPLQILLFTHPWKRRDTIHAYEWLPPGMRTAVRVMCWATSWGVLLYLLALSRYFTGFYWLIILQLCVFYWSRQS